MVRPTIAIACALVCGSALAAGSNILMNTDHIPGTARAMVNALVSAGIISSTVGAGILVDQTCATGATGPSGCPNTGTAMPLGYPQLVAASLSGSGTTLYQDNSATIASPTDAPYRILNNSFAS